MRALHMFYRFLFSKRAESVIRSLARLAVVASFVSVCALIVVLSIMNGFNRNIEQKLLVVEPHLAIDNLTAQQVDTLKAKLAGRYTDIVQVSEQDLLLRTVDGLFSGAIAKGLSGVDVQTFLSRVLKVKGSESSLPFDMQLGANEILVGVELAKSLNIYQGDQVTLIPPESLLLPSGEIPNLERVQVRAILQTDVPGFDSKVIVYNRDSSLRRLMKAETLKNVTEVRLLDPSQHKSLAKELVKDMGLPEKSVNTWATRNSSLFFALRLERLAMMSLLGLSVLVTSFSIIMVLLIFIAEKQKDIGLLMALGLSGRGAKLLFGKIGLLLSLTGSMLGFLVGVLISYLVEKYPLNFMPDVYVDTTLPSQLVVSDLIFCFIGILLISLLATGWPVWRAMRLTPAEALKGQSTFRRLR